MRLLLIALFFPLVFACQGFEVDEATEHSTGLPPDLSDEVEVEIGVDGDGDGYVADDCADDDADIHPFNPELPNGIDDNCNGFIDEPFAWSDRTRPDETATYAQVPRFRIEINDPITLDYMDNGGVLAYQLRYQQLAKASADDEVTPVELLDAFTGWSPGTRELTFNPNSSSRGFAVRQPYWFRIRFFTSEGTPLGEESEKFYTMTGGAAGVPSGTLKWGRIDLALAAFEQYRDQQFGLIGANGSLEPDGARFTGSALSPLHPNYKRRDDRLWCDWFYHWLGASVTDSVDGVLEDNVVVYGGTTFWQQVMNPNAVPNAFRDPIDDGCGTEPGGDVIYAGCQDYASGELALDTDDNRFFSNDPDNIYYDADESAASAQKVGNYLAIARHAGMFLAFDPDGDDGIGTVWSIEGNVKGYVKVVPRPQDSEKIMGFGQLAIHMFE